MGGKRTFHGFGASVGYTRFVGDLAAGDLGGTNLLTLGLTYYGV